MDNKSNLTPTQFSTIVMVLLEQQEKQPNVDKLVSLTKKKMELQSKYSLTDERAWYIANNRLDPQIERDYCSSVADVGIKMLNLLVP